MGGGTGVGVGSISGLGIGRVLEAGIGGLKVLVWVLLKDMLQRLLELLQLAAVVGGLGIGLHPQQYVVQR